MIVTDVAPGVHRLEDAYANWYLVEDDTGVTIVDAGVPTSWATLTTALQRIGRRPSDVRALVLTHAHFDHVGIAERIRTTLDVPVYVHQNDVPIARHPWRYDHERARLPYLLTQVRAMPIVAALVRNRAFWPPAIGELTRFDDATGRLPVPGEPIVVPTPGHTLGHCALHLPDRDCVLAGDAVVMLDPYTARRGPRVVARAATVDSERNLRTLDTLLDTGAGTVLTGHGDPWRRGVSEAVAVARATPVA
jgi:glyoxylase-like metal-dependent hydrolase (beta-lactamase superfamily II)